MREASQQLQLGMIVKQARKIAEEYAKQEIHKAMLEIEKDCLAKALVSINENINILKEVHNYTGQSVNQIILKMYPETNDNL